MPEEKTVQEQPKEEPKRSSAIVKMLMVVLLALTCSAVGGIVSFYMLNRAATAASGEAEAAEAAPSESEKIIELLEKGAVVPLEPFVVNLADKDMARYLRIKVSLMIDDKEKLPQIIENQALQLKLRDLILRSLTSKTSHDLIDEHGKDKLRNEIQDKISLYFHEPKLVDVMFTEFVIQL